MRCWRFCLVILFAVGGAHAATIYVPDNFSTIQEAIDAASSGDVIIVRPGTYVENIDFVGKAIIVMSEMGPEVTVIDGGQLDSVVKFQNHEENDSELDGFSITNGRADEGGGIYCFGSSPIISNSIISDNSAEYPYAYRGSGGGISCFWASPVVVNNIITNNRADLNGGGVYCLKFSSPSIVNNTITDNIAGETAGGGGGILCDYHSKPLIMNNIISNNLALCASGGILCSWYSSATIKNNLISNNVCVDGNAGGIGSGAYCDLIIENNVIIGNSATGDWRNGGGLTFGDAKVHIVNNIISNNKANWRGGGIYCSSTTHPNPSALVMNNTIVNNVAGDSGGGIYGDRFFPEITNTIFWNNSAPTGPELASRYGSPPTTCCDIKGGWPGTGNIDADPLFVDLAGDDLHITFESPCRDSGDNSALPQITDFEGDPRIANDVVDIGADEFYYHLYHTGDAIPGGTVEIKVIGFPLAPVTLAWGYEILDRPYPVQHGDLHIWPFVWCGFVGNISQGGVLSIPITVSSNWSSGDFAPMQALVGPWGGAHSQLTNLTTVVVE